MLTNRLITNDADLAALEEPWNELASGMPLRSWDWLATWWKHYCKLGERELHVVALYDGPSLVGIAPWYFEHTLAKGSALCLLGSGHVCTDHVSLICRPPDTERVAIAIGEYLSTGEDWDRLRFSAIDEGDEGIGRLIDELECRGCLATREHTSNCWVLELPGSWSEYLQMVSQTHRRQLKKWQKDYLDSGRARLHVATNVSELETAWDILVDLHQQRRNSLGEPGCFASEEFHSFHRDVTERLLASGQLRLSWIELDGAPLTAEYHLAGRDTVYTYQSGMDVSRPKDAPGRLAFLVTVKRAIEEGFCFVDFMRGNERYKAHWRAVAQPQFDYRVFPNRPLSRLRGHLESAGSSLKQWVKQGVVSVMR